MHGYRNREPPAPEGPGLVAQLEPQTAKEANRSHSHFRVAVEVRYPVTSAEGFNNRVDDFVAVSFTSATPGPCIETTMVEHLRERPTDISRQVLSRISVRLSSSARSVRGNDWLGDAILQE